jgi:hypothetical protein
MGLDPNDSPLLFCDTGLQDVYALDCKSYWDVSISGLSSASL